MLPEVWAWLPEVWASAAVCRRARPAAAANPRRGKILRRETMLDLDF